MTDKTEKIGFRGTLEYRRKIQQAAFDRGMKVQTFLEYAVELALAEASPNEKTVISRTPRARSTPDRVDLGLLNEELRSAVQVLADLSAKLAPAVGKHGISTKENIGVPGRGDDSSSGVERDRNDRSGLGGSIEAIKTPEKGLKSA